MTEQIESRVCTGPCGESKPIYRFRIRTDRPGEQRKTRCIDCDQKKQPYTPLASRKRQANQFYANDPWGHKARAARKAALKSKK